MRFAQKKRCVGCLPHSGRCENGRTLNTKIQHGLAVCEEHIDAAGQAIRLDDALVKTAFTQSNRGFSGEYMAPAAMLHFSNQQVEGVCSAINDSNAHLSSCT